MTKSEIFELCRSINFPQTELSEKSLINNFANLKQTNSSKYANCCTKVIQVFHPSLWQANRNGYLSPFDAWYDDDLLNKCIDNRLKYKGAELSPFDIRAGFSIAKIAPKVSIFRPAMAKYIIQKYLSDFKEVFDPCSGYSGRLLGCAALDKKYIGQDINPVTINESNELAKYYNIDCKLSIANSICSSSTYECLFTCPPYSELENWNQEIEVLSCDEWIDILINNFNCKKYVFVIDKTSKYKNNIVEVINNTSHFGSNKEYVIVIDKKA